MMNEAAHNELKTLLDNTFEGFGHVLKTFSHSLQTREVGTVRYVGCGIARVDGLMGVESEELVRFADGGLGMVFNLDQEEAGIILLNESTGISAGSEVRRTEKVVDVPVGEALLGRIVDALGSPLDNLGPIRTSHRRAVEQDAPAIMD